MAIYSIKDLERLSGIKAHTLRVWEKRYNLLQPRRTETNIRYYLDQDLQHLLKVVFLQKNGHKISKIAAMSHEKIVEEASHLMDTKEGLDGQHDALTLSILQLDRYKVERLLTHKIDDLGFEQCLFEVIYPLLEKVNLLYITNSFEQYHENFLIQIIKQKLHAEINSLSQPNTRSECSTFLFSNKGNEHDLTLLLSDYYLRKAGCSTIHLGSGIDTQDFISLRQGFGTPAYVLVMLSPSTQEQDAMEYITELHRCFPESTIWLAGYMLDSPPQYDNMELLNDVLHLSEIAQTALSEISR